MPHPDHFINPLCREQYACQKYCPRDPITPLLSRSRVSVRISDDMKASVNPQRRGRVCYPTFPENTFFPESCTTIPENIIIPEKIRRGVLRHRRKVIYISEKHRLVNFPTTFSENTYPFISQK